MGNVCLNVFYLGSPGFSFVIFVFVTKAFGCVGITFPMSDVPGLASLENSSMNFFLHLPLSQISGQQRDYSWVCQVRQDAFGDDGPMVGEEPSWNVAWGEALA